MADVKIVDIDNVQWNIKDQEARNKIAVLETLTKEDLNFDNASITCIKRNGVATLMIVNKIVINPHSNIILTNNLPKKYCPVVPSFRTSFIHNASDAYCGQVIIRSNGSMEIYNSSDQSVELGGSITNVTYVAQD